MSCGGIGKIGWEFPVDDGLPGRQNCRKVVEFPFFRQADEDNAPESSLLALSMILDVAGPFHFHDERKEDRRKRAPACGPL